jgi:hypothetical protein
MQLSLPLPRYRQLDWDAILTPTTDEFYNMSLVRSLYMVHLLLCTTFAHVGGDNLLETG